MCLDMAPFYELICEEQGWPVDTTLLESMKKVNEEALKKLDERLKDAEENLGETEISDTLLARAEHFAKIGDKVREQHYELTMASLAIACAR